MHSKTRLIAVLEALIEKLLLVSLDQDEVEHVKAEEVSLCF